MKKKDIGLLHKLTSIQSSYTEDTEIMAYIKTYVKETLKLDYSTDNFGNVYVTKGNGENGYKTIVCHTDTVHSIYEYRKVLVDEESEFMYSIGMKKKSSVLQQVGVGGDDKVGIYMCLKTLEDFNDIKTVFFRFEESGCKGSRACDMNFFDNSNFVIEPDRKEYGDFIINSASTLMCSDEFVNTMKPLYEKYNYKIVNGISTDVDKLKSRGLKVCSINLGCGYYNPHSENEVIYLPNVDLCYSLITEIFNTYGDTKFEHIYVKPDKYEKYSYGSYSDNLFSRRPLNNKNDKNYFTNTKNSNFFLNKYKEDLYEKPDKIFDDILYNLTKTKYRSFVKMEGSDFFKLNRLEAIPVDSNPGYVYLPFENKFYNINLNNYEESDVLNYILFKALEVEDTNEIFVYSDLGECWLKKIDAYWNDSYQSWDMKEIAENKNTA